MNLAQYILSALVRIYRYFISPAKAAFFGPAGRCRYSPSCSEYALEAIHTHGAVYGTWLSTRRVCSCHPWGGCGYDPVPPAAPRTETAVSTAPKPLNLS